MDKDREQRMADITNEKIESTTNTIVDKAFRSPIGRRITKLAAVLGITALGTTSVVQASASSPDTQSQPIVGPIKGEVPTPEQEHRDLINAANERKQEDEARKAAIKLVDQSLGPRFGHPDPMQKTEARQQGVIIGAADQNTVIEEQRDSRERKDGQQETVAALPSFTVSKEEMDKIRLANPSFVGVSNFALTNIDLQLNYKINDPNALGDLPLEKKLDRLASKIQDANQNDKLFSKDDFESQNLRIQPITAISENPDGTGTGTIAFKVSKRIMVEGKGKDVVQSVFVTDEEGKVITSLVIPEGQVEVVGRTTEDLAKQLGTIGITLRGDFFLASGVENDGTVTIKTMADGDLPIQFISGDEKVMDGHKAIATPQPIRYNFGGNARVVEAPAENLPTDNPIDSEGNYTGTPWTGENAINLKTNVVLQVDNDGLKGTLKIDGKSYPINSSTPDRVSSNSRITPYGVEVVDINKMVFFDGVIGTRQITGYPIPSVPTEIEVLDFQVSFNVNGETKKWIVSVQLPEARVYKAGQNNINSKDKFLPWLKPGTKLDLNFLVPKNNTWAEVSEKVINFIDTNAAVLQADKNNMSLMMKNGDAQREDILAIETDNNANCVGTVLENLVIYP